MTVDWQFVWAIAPSMLKAAQVTVVVTLLSSVLAGALGLPVAAARFSSRRMLRRLAIAYVELLRGVPLLIWIYLVFFILPLIGVTFGAFVVGVLSLGIYYSSYTAELYRAGIESVPIGQWEAASALNLSRFDTLYRVIIPQARPIIWAPLGNYLIEMFKATPLLATIGMHEMLGEGQQIAADTFQYVEVYLWVGLIFLGLSYPAGLLVRRFDRRGWTTEVMS